MNEITVITPPDVLHNDALSILFISLSANNKAIVNEILQNSDMHMNVYIYESDFDDFEWVIRLIKSVDFVFIDLDNCDPITRLFASHIIAQPHSFYLTNDSTIPYNLISKNKVYDFMWLENLTRGNNE